MCVGIGILLSFVYVDVFGCFEKCWCCCRCWLLMNLAGKSSDLLENVMVIGEKEPVSCQSR